MSEPTVAATVHSTVKTEIAATSAPSPTVTRPLVVATRPSRGEQALASETLSEEGNPNPSSPAEPASENFKVSLSVTSKQMSEAQGKINPLSVSSLGQRSVGSNLVVVSAGVK